MTVLNAANAVDIFISPWLRWKKKFIPSFYLDSRLIKRTEWKIITEVLVMSNFICNDLILRYYQKDQGGKTYIINFYCFQPQRPL